jgi:hypothetical protein
VTDDQFVREVQRRLGVTADGVAGPRTMAALDRVLPVSRPDTTAKPFWPTQAGVPAVFGPAGGPDCTAGRVSLPFAFPLAWDDSQRINSFSCHTKVAAPLTRIFKAAASHYGETTFRLLRLDQFGGCFNHRPMRGGSTLSMHSWGIAVDLDPVNNGLNTRAPAATFSRPDYAPFWRIVEAEGAISLGKEIGRDWMHFQFARLS